MLKPFYVRGQRIDGDLLMQCEKNGLTKNNVGNRVLVQHWTLEEAVSTPKGVNRRPKKRPFERKPLSVNGEVKSYFLPLETVWKLYGKPGEIKYPERLSKGWV